MSLLIASAADDAAVASAALAAVAATASWATVWQNRKERQEAATPDLTARYIVEATGDVVVQVENVSAAPATKINFLLVTDDLVDYGAVGTGMLFPGQAAEPIRTRVRLSLPIALDTYPAKLIVTFMDRRGALHARNHQGERVSYEPKLFRRFRLPARMEIAQDLCPGIVVVGKTDAGRSRPVTESDLSVLADRRPRPAKRGVP